MSINPPPLDLTEIAEKLVAERMGVDAATLAKALAASFNEPNASVWDGKFYPEGAEFTIKLEVVREEVERLVAAIREREQSAVSQALQEAAEQLPWRDLGAVRAWLRDRARAAQGDPQETERA